jgi:hypothetical protein
LYKKNAQNANAERPRNTSNVKTKLGRLPQVPMDNVGRNQPLPNYGNSTLGLNRENPTFNSYGGNQSGPFQFTSATSLPNAPYFRGQEHFSNQVIGKN